MRTVNWPIEVQVHFAHDAGDLHFTWHGGVGERELEDTSRLDLFVA